jgi:hypothetical protein
VPEDTESGHSRAIRSITRTAFVTAGTSLAMVSLLAAKAPFGRGVRAD